MDFEVYYKLEGFACGWWTGEEAVISCTELINL
jgi:hypothetical protein